MEVVEWKDDDHKEVGGKRSRSPGLLSLSLAYFHPWLCVSVPDPYLVIDNKPSLTSRSSLRLEKGPSLLQLLNLLEDVQSCGEGQKRKPPIALCTDRLHAAAKHLATLLFDPKRVNWTEADHHWSHATLHPRPN